MSWYGQKPPGSWKATPENVRLLDRKSELPPNAAATYTEYVEDMVNDVLSEGWQGWIAPQAHRDDPKPRDQWVWRFANTNHMLEALYLSYNMSLTQFTDIIRVNNGMGWRFPKLIVFQESPRVVLLDIMLRYKVPWGIESELRERPDIEPPPNDDWKKAVKKRLDGMGYLARDILDIVENV